MREILFRGKDVKENWHIGLLAKSGNGWYISNSAGIPLAYEVIPSTVGQYTGLTDKNGNKIFEGDIVQGAWETIFAVYYDSNYLQYRAKVKDDYTREIDYYGNSTQIEVIGNIYDNPESLKEAEQE